MKTTKLTTFAGAFAGFFVLAAATLYSSHANAESFVVVPVTSYHINHSTRPNSSKKYNTSNYGIGFGNRSTTEYNWSFGYQVGTYNNSYDRRSNYLAGDIGYQLNDTVRLGVLVGAISGYGGNNVSHGVGPMLAPQIEITVAKHATVTGTFIPTTIPGGSNAIGLSVGYKF